MNTHTHTQIKTTNNDNYVGFPGSSVVKNLSPTQEMWVQSLHWEDPLEKEMAPHSSILTWEIPWTRFLVGDSHGVTRFRRNLGTKQQQMVSTPENAKFV